MVKIEMKGEPDDLIRKCDECDYCFFEDILTDDQRKIKVLKQHIPKIHPRREIIEQLCGMEIDEHACPMKYDLMRMSIPEEFLIQAGCIKNFAFDIGKKANRRIRYNEAGDLWRKSGLDGDPEDCYAKRFRELYPLGVRKIKIYRKNTVKIIEKSIFTIDEIYETILSKKENYKKSVELAKQRLEEHLYRDKNGL